MLTGLYDGLLYLDQESVVMNYGKSLICIQELLDTLRETSSVAATAEKCGVGVQDVITFLCHQADVQDRPAHILLGWEYFSWGGRRINPKQPLPPVPEPWWRVAKPFVPLYISEPVDVGDDESVVELSEDDIPF